MQVQARYSPQDLENRNGEVGQVGILLIDFFCVWKFDGNIKSYVPGNGSYVVWTICGTGVVIQEASGLLG